MSITTHECEDWQIQDSAEGGAYCSACGRPKPPAEFTLGQRVAYTEHIRRRSSRPGEFGGPDKIWSNNPGPGLDDQHWPGGEGIIVGKRTLSNGNTRWMGEETGYIYDSLEHFTAYLIAYDLQRKPVHVLPEHITALDEPAAPDDDDQHFKDTGCDSSLHPEDCLATKQGVLL